MPEEMSTGISDNHTLEALIECLYNKISQKKICMKSYFASRKIRKFTLHLTEVVYH